MQINSTDLQGEASKKANKQKLSIFTKGILPENSYRNYFFFKKLTAGDETIFDSFKIR